MGYVYSEGLERLGRIDSDGYMYNEKLQRIGRIEKDGYIYDESLRRLGRVDRDGHIFNEALEHVGRIDRDGYVFSEGLKRVGHVDKDIVDRIFGISQSNSLSVDRHGSSNSGSANDSSGGGFAVGLIIFGIFAVIVAIMAMPETAAVLLAPPGCFIFSGFCLITTLIGLLIPEQTFKKSFMINYVLTMMLWFVILIWGGVIENIFIFILSIPLGFILMAIFSLCMGSISYVLEMALRYLHRKKILKYFVLLILAVALVMWIYFSNVKLSDLMQMMG